MSEGYQSVYRSELSVANRATRLLWSIVYTLFFRPSPWFLYRWRVMLLKIFGAGIDKTCIVHSSARIYAPWNLIMHPRACLAARVHCYNVDKVEIGIDATVSDGTYLCTASHDIDSTGRELKTAPIQIGDYAWVFAHARIGPGVVIEDQAVVAMGAVVVRPVAAGDVVGGNPAKFIRKRGL